MINLFFQINGKKPVQFGSMKEGGEFNIGCKDVTGKDEEILVFTDEEGQSFKIYSEHDFSNPLRSGKDLNTQGI